MGRNRQPQKKRKKPGEGNYVAVSTRKAAGEEKKSAKGMKDMVTQHKLMLESTGEDGEDATQRQGLLDVMERSILRRKRERQMYALQVPQLRRQVRDKRDEIAQLDAPCMKQMKNLAEQELAELEQRLAEATDNVSNDTLKRDEKTLGNLRRLQTKKRLQYTFTTLQAAFGRAKGGVATAEQLGLQELDAVMKFNDTPFVLSQELSMCPKCVFKKLTKSITMTGAKECQQCGLLLMAPPSGGFSSGTKDGGRGDSTQQLYISAQHTMKKLAEAQGTIMHRITPETLQQMGLIIWMRRIRPEELVAWVMRAIQAKMGLSNMYELGGMFITVMRGYSPPHFKHALNKELPIMVKMVHRHWKEFQAVYDNVMEREALRTGHKVQRRKANYPNAPYIIWRLLQLRGVDYSDWVTPILEPRNLKRKDIVLWLVARHLGWDMRDILFKGADVLREKQKAAQQILNRPLPPLQVFGSPVCAHWAASSDLRPCILVVQTVDRQWFVVVGPLKTTEELAELEGDASEPNLRDVCVKAGLKVDDATAFAVKQIASEDLEVPEEVVPDWGYHAVPPTCDLFRTHIAPLHAALDTAIDAFVQAEEESREASLG